MSFGGSRIVWMLTAILAVALALTFALRLPCSRDVAGPPKDAAPARRGEAARGAVAVTGPDAAAVRAAIDRTLPWLAATRVRPEQEGLGRFRFYVMEVHCWYLLYAFADDPARREQYRGELVERLRLLGDGRPLLEYIQRTRVPSVIADLLILMMMARHVDVRVPAIEQALPALYQAGLDEPQRPIGMQIPLTWLAAAVGLETKPTLAEQRRQGMLRTQPREATMKARDVYYFTHEVYGLTDYGFRAGDFDPEEQAYLERTLPFWSLFHVILAQADLTAEVSICHQVAGTTSTYGYGEGLRFLVETQSAEGTFGESKVDSQLPLDIRLGYLHTTMVALHALLGHEALLLKGALPGLPR